VKFSQAIICIRTATLLPLSGFRLCEVFKMVATRTTDFQNVIPCSLVHRYQTFRSWYPATKLHGVAFQRIMIFRINDFNSHWWDRGSF